jgi:hypothetical protein
VSDDFSELFDDVPPAERARLEHARDLLRAAGPMPELPPRLEEPVAPPEPPLIPFLPKRRSVAAAVAAAAVIAAAFGGGYLVGHGNTSGSQFTAVRNVRMHPTKVAPEALASIQIGKGDSHGNWPMLVKLSGLNKLPKGGYYALWLTRNGKPVAPCGWFRADGNTSVQLTVAYSLKRFDGWALTEQMPGDRKPGPTLLTT